MSIGLVPHESNSFVFLHLEHREISILLAHCPSEYHFESKTNVESRETGRCGVIHLPTSLLEALAVRCHREQSDAEL